MILAFQIRARARDGHRVACTDKCLIYMFSDMHAVNAALTTRRYKYGLRLFPLHRVLDQDSGSWPCDAVTDELLGRTARQIAWNREAWSSAALAATNADEHYVPVEPVITYGLSTYIDRNIAHLFAFTEIDARDWLAIMFGQANAQLFN